MLRQSRLFAKSLATAASRSRVAANSFSMRALPLTAPRFTAAALFSSKKMVTPPPSSEDDDEEAPEPLHSALAKELAEESAENIDADADAELADVTKLIKKTFSIKESLGKGVVHLHGTVGGTKVHVTFDCQDESETGMDMDEFEMPPQGQGGDNEEEPTLEFGINFTARLTSPDGAKMVIDAVAGQDLQILNVQHVPSGQDEEDGELYGGPVFDQLSEGLQDSIYAHLEAHGIDEDLCFYILAVSRSKEQSEYVHWLEGMLSLAGGEGRKKLLGGGRARG